MESPAHQVTQLLHAWSEGNQSAREELIPLVYEELRRMARRYMMRQNPGTTLQTTALIHEAYLKMAGDADNNWQNRAHFYGVSATVMRHILVDRARARRSAKRGGGARAVSLDEGLAVSTERASELIALDDALNELAHLHERQAKVIELRFFGGLSVEETAEFLEISVETVMRDWRAAKAWLSRTLNAAAESS